MSEPPAAASIPPLALVGLCALVAVAYATSFASDFVFDNRTIILEDPRLRAFTLDNLRDILTRGYWWPYALDPLYRPFTTLTYLLNYAVLGNAASPFGYHVINLAIHLANVCMVALLAVRFSGRMILGLAIVAVWAVHPVLTEAVTNIVGRADLLASFGILGALFCHVRIGEGAKRLPLWRGGLVASATMAAFSKEFGVVVIAVIAGHDLLVGPPIAWPRRIRAWIPVAIPVAVFLAARSAVAQSAGEAHFPFVDNPIAGAGFLEGRLTALAVAGRYVWRIVWPQQLSADYSFQQIPLISGTLIEWAACGTALVAVIAALATLSRSKRLFFVLGSAALIFLPASNLLFATGTIMAERLMYLPSLAVVASLVVLAHTLFGRLQQPRVFAALIILIVTSASVRTFTRNRDWRDELALWQATLRVSPKSFKAHSAYAEALYRSDAAHSRLDEAIVEKDRSIALLEGLPNPAETIKPFYQAAAYHFERGERLLARDNDAAKARPDFERSRSLVQRYLSLIDSARQLPNAPSEKDQADALLMLSSVTLRLSDDQGAVAAAAASRARQPFEPAAYQVEAAALIAAKRYDDAAIALLTGVTLTGSLDLRRAAIQLYASGLDRERCATTRSGSGAIVLNNECAIVHRHLCAATAAAIATFERANRPEMAERTRITVLPQFNCAPR